MWPRLRELNPRFAGNDSKMVVAAGIKRPAPAGQRRIGMRNITREEKRVFYYCHSGPGEKSGVVVLNLSSDGKALSIFKAPGVSALGTQFFMTVTAL